MELKKKRSAFPFYLDSPSVFGISRMLGFHIRSVRGKGSPDDIARKAKVSSEQILAMESGLFLMSFGKLQDVIRNGYKIEFTDLLEWYCSQRLKGLEEDSFKRNYFCSMSIPVENKDDIGPLFIGGDPKSYLWAIPMQRLRNQRISMQLLELAPYRKRMSVGSTPSEIYRGTQVVHVIHGTIQCCINNDRDSFQKRVKAGESIHLFTSRRHYFENTEMNTSALLLIVQIPEFSGLFTNKLRKFA
jgi:hypothetical protein